MNCMLLRTCEKYHNSFQNLSISKFLLQRVDELKISVFSFFLNVFVVHVSGFSICFITNSVSGFCCMLK
ncbi:hypothetical protein L6452_36355 [Arctium lappa]|uniref:Uncharacterized protein n=1 Tax=Arctium lappa TaxID=4217 RepID=A0ACB8Y9V6_ARCLA|nr:hypothetical protein L6452_36355 [Arctium lappa]